jgi:hypothetical protein
VCGQMQRLWTRPANLRNATAQLALDPLRRRKSRLSERDGEEAPEHHSDVEAARSLPDNQHPRARHQQRSADGDPAASRTG